MQLALAPMRGQLSGPAQCFGVSGYSGAGTSPSDKNDPEKLRDNLMPYALAGHVHEREVSRAPGRAGANSCRTSPRISAASPSPSICSLRERHVGSGIASSTVIAMPDEPLVEVQDEAPWISAIAGQARRPDRWVHAERATASDWSWSSVLDNLLKGAATQAMQNLNLAFGLPDDQRNSTLIQGLTT